METLCENNYYEVQFDKDKLLISGSWKEGTENMTEKELRDTVEMVIEQILKHKPGYFSTDDRKRAYVYSLETQKWVAQRYAQACINVALKKFALILPTDFISQLSTEQTVDEAGSLPFDLRYFDSTSEALQWFDQ